MVSVAAVLLHSFDEAKVHSSINTDFRHFNKFAQHFTWRAQSYHQTPPQSLAACQPDLTCVLNDVQAELHLARTHFSNPHTEPSQHRCESDCIASLCSSVQQQKMNEQLVRKCQWKKQRNENKTLRFPIKSCERLPLRLKPMRAYWFQLKICQYVEQYFAGLLQFVDDSTSCWGLYFLLPCMLRVWEVSLATRITRIERRHSFVSRTPVWLIADADGDTYALLERCTRFLFRFPIRVSVSVKSFWDS